MAKKHKKKEPISTTSMSWEMSDWGKSDIGITQLLKDTGKDYFRLNKIKLKKVM